MRRIRPAVPHRHGDANADDSAILRHRLRLTRTPTEPQRRHRLRPWRRAQTPTPTPTSPDRQRRPRQRRRRSRPIISFYGLSTSTDASGGGPPGSVNENQIVGIVTLPINFSNTTTGPARATACGSSATGNIEQRCRQHVSHTYTRTRHLQRHADDRRPSAHAHQLRAGRLQGAVLRRRAQEQRDEPSGADAGFTSGTHHVPRPVAATTRSATSRSSAAWSTRPAAARAPPSGWPVMRPSPDARGRGGDRPSSSSRSSCRSSCSCVMLAWSIWVEPSLHTTRSPSRLARRRATAIVNQNITRVTERRRSPTRQHSGLTATNVDVCFKTYDSDPDELFIVDR